MINEIKSKYNIETSEFGLSDSGFHLLRSKFNYETIRNEEITSITIEKGKLINNWIIIFSIGLLLIGFSFNVFLNLINAFNDPAVRKIYIEEIIVPVMTLMMGAYCLYMSLKNGEVVRISYHTKAISLPLTELKMQNKISEFVSLICSNPLLKSKF